MSNTDHATLRWIQIGIICGLLASMIYPLLIFAPMPSLAAVFLVMAFGPLLSLGCVGLYYFINLDEQRIAATIAVVSNIIAGVLITTMALVQLAIRDSKPDALSETEIWMWYSMNTIHYGLDVAWDVYIFIGTLLFAIAMYDHPKFGKVFSVTGIVVSVAMIILNAISFPNPPGSSGLIDMGPFIGLWYLAMTIKMTLSRKWIHQQIG